MSINLELDSNTVIFSNMQILQQEAIWTIDMTQQIFLGISNRTLISIKETALLVNKIQLRI